MRVVRWIAAGLGAFVLLLLIVVLAANQVANSQIQRRVDAPAGEALDVAHASVDRGRHLAEAVTSCMDCHTPQLAGKAMVDDPVFGRIWSANLTRGKGGVGATDDDAAFERAIRHGLSGEGRRLLIMPSHAYAALSDTDTAAIIAFVRSVPPVDNPTQSVQLGPIGKMLVLTGKMHFDADQISAEPAPHLDATPDTSAAYGNYLARVAGCMTCHGPDLAGGHYVGSPTDPPATNITPAGIGTWSRADLGTLIHTGKRPNGSQVNPFMPWSSFLHMTEDEIDAIYAFLKTVPPVAKKNG